MLFFILILILFVVWSIWGFFSSNVEQLEYFVVRKINGYEIRQYPKHIVAQTAVIGSREESINIGFRIVAGYIFGGNMKKENVAMTAPVFSQKERMRNVSESIAMTAPVLAKKEQDLEIISFSMPSSYTLETLPIPTDQRVKIVTIEAKKYAAMRFFGYRSDSRVRKAQKKLINILAQDGVEMRGNFIYAGYSAPWTPPWMIRNEVLIEIE